MNRLLVVIFLAVLSVFSHSIWAIATTSEIEAEGTGKTEREAVEDALRNAIETTIGVYVDADTQMKNNQIIKDSILTGSKGYIDKYRLLGVTNTDGLVNVQIKALVKIEDVKSKLTGLNISTHDISDSANTHARLSTKLKRSQDIGLILKKELNEFTKLSEVLKMLTVKVVNYTIKENQLASDGTVPYHVTFQLEMDVQNYNTRAKELMNALRDLGATEDIYPLDLNFEKSRLSIKNKNFVNYADNLRNSRSKKDNFVPCIGVVTIASTTQQDFHNFCYPTEFKNISYPWKDEKSHRDTNSHLRFNDQNFEMILTFSSDTSPIFKKIIRVGDLRNRAIQLLKYQVLSPGGAHYLYPTWQTQSIVLAPFMTAESCDSTCVGPSVIFSISDRIPVKLLYDIRKVEVRIGEKL
ncbi:MAG: hypothetical protein OEL83_08400 [Desulforhopalus sp.]|nr:hypothetical protein [Desulforhopalus sp.]